MLDVAAMRKRNTHPEIFVTLKYSDTLFGKNVNHLCTQEKKNAPLGSENPNIYLCDLLQWTHTIM